MNLQDFEYLENNLDTQGLYGSDTCIANLFLLQENTIHGLKSTKIFCFAIITEMKTAAVMDFLFR